MDFNYSNTLIDQRASDFAKKIFHHINLDYLLGIFHCCFELISFVVMASLPLEVD